MIAQISAAELLSKIPDGIQPLRVAALAKAYGDLPFCRYYLGEGLLAAQKENDITVYLNDTDDVGEVSDFLLLSGVSAVSVNRPLPLPFHERSGNCFCGKLQPEESSLLKEGTPREVAPLLEAAFPYLPEDGSWYADLSHRIRHGVSYSYLYDNKATATVLCRDSEYFFIGMVAVSPTARRQGLGRKMLAALSALYPQTLAVYSQNPAADKFYTACGLEITDKWYEYTRDIDL